MDFLECDDPIDLSGNKTRDDTASGGCYKVHYLGITQLSIYFKRSYHIQYFDIRIFNL